LPKRGLNYPRERQHYLSGFVLDGANAAVEWPRIDAAASEAVALGVAETFIWAQPQVSRDGYSPASRNERRCNDAII
jgi:hypothetical protein